MFRKTKRSFFLHSFAVLSALTLALVACNLSADIPAQAPVEVPTEPVITDVPTKYKPMIPLRVRQQ